MQHRTRRPSACIATSLACLSLLASSAYAQADPSGLRVQPQFSAWLAGPVATATARKLEPLAPPPGSRDAAATRFRQNQARQILAAGTGFALSAAITPAYVLPHREPCWGSNQHKGRAPLMGAAWLGGIGFAAAVGGGTWLGLESRKRGHYTSRRERAVAAGIGAATFVVGQLLLGGVFFMDQICHT